MATTYFTQNTGATTVFKNSGILRYRFGNGRANGVGAPVLAAGLAGQDGYVAYCLGDNAVTTPDSDGQLYGMTAGYDQITPSTTASIFSGLAGSGVVAAANAAAIGAGGGIRFPPDYPNASAATSQARLKANGRISAGQKVIAWFQFSNDGQGYSTIAGEEPLVIVQTEVVQNRLRTSGTISGAGETFITSIRVGVFNDGDSTSRADGVLYVWIPHSFEDIPGNAAQDVQPVLGMT